MLRIGLTLALVTLGGCDAGTGGRLTSVSFRVESPGAAAITLEDGATVELTRARLSFGPLYVFESPPPTARPWWRQVSDAVVPSAHAHAGHDFFSGGRVMTEWIRPTVLDLLTRAHELGSGPAIAGSARAMSVHLLRSTDNEGQALRLSGTLTREGVSRPFSLDVALPGGFEDQRVDFVPVELELEAGRIVVITVDPAAWFRGARFTEPVLDPLASDSQTGRAVQVNLRRFAAWGGRTVEGT